VKHNRRYVWGAEVQAFLDTVLATNHGRDQSLRKGMILYRAQMGIDWEEREDEGISVEMGYGAERMKPLPFRATEGRANPAGAPVLYLGTTEQTAISEIRPWIGALASVAQFELRRPLRTLDLSINHGKSSFMGDVFRHLLSGTKPTLQEKEKSVWTDIDNAFSRPVTRTEDNADYAPTQILAELFRDAGYDAIAYRSQFGENGFNVAVFNVTDADAINCAPYEVTKIDVGFKEAGNRWFASKQPNDDAEG
jgi:hypothetical protein